MRRILAAATIAITVTGCSNMSTQDEQLAALLENSVQQLEKQLDQNISLEERIVALADEKAEAQNLQESAETSMAAANRAVRRELSVSESAIETVNALVSCLSAQQKLTSTFARLLSEEPPDQSTVDQASTEAEVACTEAQARVQNLRATQRQ